MIRPNQPVENQQVIGDYYPRPARPAPDPDNWLTRVMDEVEQEFAEFPEWKKRGAENYLGFADDAKCPHNCKGCTCRTDPRQMTLPFDEASQ